ncbi:unnamed protein product [Rhizoctonia solani]|uniref:Uncharacterized protein n=1 Tax=Rhizoctonia solani TaxID=456999 RepID=A0A8H2XJ62_9AGAM|nr:unnamed protein product [Rhizoctonia solani]
MLALAPIFPGAAPGVTRKVSLLHNAQTNDSSLGASIRALVDLEGSEDSPRNEMDLSLITLVEHWWWSQSVMGALPLLQTLLASVTSAIPLSDILPHLFMPLISHSHTLRSSALQLLVGPCVRLRLQPCPVSSPPKLPFDSPEFPRTSGKLCKSDKCKRDDPG